MSVGLSALDFPEAQKWSVPMDYGCGRGFGFVDILLHSDVHIYIYGTPPKTDIFKIVTLLG